MRKKERWWKGEMRMRIHWTIDSIKEKEKIIIKNKKNELNCVTLNIIDRTNGKLLPYVTVSRQKQIVKIFLHHLLWSVLYNKQYKTVREANILGQIPRWKEKKYQQKKLWRNKQRSFEFRKVKKSKFYTFIIPILPRPLRLKTKYSWSIHSFVQMYIFSRFVIIIVFETKWMTWNVAK
jgi:hypothetical protein